MKRAGAVLRDAGIPFALAGGLACWARGGPATDHDVDFLIKPDDADRAADAFESAGLRVERPPEGWLIKTYVDDTLVDLVYEPAGGAVTDEWFERAEQLEVKAMRIPVASLEDVLTTKLLALTEQEPDYGPVLEIARTLREQVDWEVVRERTAGSPFAKAFFTLVEELGIVPSGTGEPSAV
ncbi:MAG: nucleotidyltransferase [Thermoleophilia bacterium]|nr:nucleotidyltransferase [Thermoleophilia bacterium]